MKRLPTYFISHGGGPWPYMKEQVGSLYAALEKSLKEIPLELPATPKAILVISGHWEEPEFSVTASAHPPMIYDYSGFPEETYKIQYPAPGDPGLARQVTELLKTAGIATRLDTTRGLDHGTFVPLAVMYPQAQVPVVELSLHEGYDPQLHWKVGQALAPLRDQGVLILASGLTYHNLRMFDGRARKASREFDDWLSETLSESSPERRRNRLIDWSRAPSARLAHPREDHLIPLMVALGAAETEKSSRIYYENDFMGGITVSSYRFG